MTTLAPAQFVRFFLAIASADLTFYVVHRALHHRTLYPWIHKQHHEYRDSSAFVAGHKSFVEYCIVTTTDILPFVLFGASVSELVAWGCVGSVYNAEGHSAMSLLFIDSNYHDVHHTDFVNNYGVQVSNAPPEGARAFVHLDARRPPHRDCGIVHSARSRTKRRRLARDVGRRRRRNRRSRQRKCRCKPLCRSALR